MIKPKNLILVRHGKTNAPEGTFYGSTDIELHPSETDRLSSIELPDSISTLYSSPRRRCLETAELLFPNYPLNIISEAKEIDFGAWEGLNYPQISERNPELIDAWTNDPDFSFPEGESLKAFQKRCEAVAQEILKLDDENIVLLCHGGVIGYLTCYFLDLDYQQSFKFRVDNASLTHLQIYADKQASLKKFNVTEGFTWLKSL